MEAWPADLAGVVTLPSGRRVRGRALRRGVPPGPTPELGVYLARRPPPSTPWSALWMPWPDFRLPSDRGAAERCLREAWARAAQERVEIACDGGRGRTGTALAVLAVLDGVPAQQAVAFVRAQYDARAAETPWQRHYVRRFAR